ncbi:glutathione peroxidase [Sinimarinibacterium sp. CAU 1509]|uniref:glutathione peroxidase n=1 Tax=Sinimarinibacterium sp. CAU 1509 TaxID=2562283 RepID=UPI001B7FA5FF|nr:glutathione peroxidase [Sinimarinibacterium sp. CAU 1509]
MTLLLFSGMAAAESPICAGLPAPTPLVGKAENGGSACDAFDGHPAVLVVNTASMCGYTPQFEGLEALYRRYRDRGLQVLGFPSDNFGGQEYDDAEQTARVCYRNYGVSFPMYAKIDVVGEHTDTLFVRLREATGAAPRWNFHKYLVTTSGVTAYDTRVKPDDPKLIAEIERALSR